MADQRLANETDNAKMSAVINSIGGESLATRMANYHIPGVSIAVLEANRLAWSYTSGVRQATPEMLFSPVRSERSGEPWQLFTWSTSASSIVLTL